jgi:Asp-tRNA(Asn)/Glu-tRNA(Gln) amidotransferase A subunit family amidase
LNRNELDYGSIEPLLLQQKITCRQITEQFLNNINEGKELNAFIYILGDRAFAKADQVDDCQLSP